jgi:hypothetical protein
MPNAECQKLATGNWKPGTGDYDKPAERVWLPSSNAWSRAAEPIDTMKTVIILQQAL